jgi:hypothetical protein
MDEAMPEWYHYHSAFEFSAGVDLALFAIPALRQPAIETETKRWLALSQIPSRDHQRYPDIRNGLRRFELIKREIERRTDRVRTYSLWLVALCGAFLAWGTAFADATPTEPLLLWLALFVALTPAIIFVGLDARARCILRESSRLRQILEKEVLPH